MFDDKKKWFQYHVPVHSPEWFQFRSTGTDYYQGGIGASEIAKFIGRSMYSPVAPEVYYHKIGMASPSRVYNDAIHWGIVLEKPIKEAWEFEDLRKDGGFSKNMMQFQETGDYTYRQRKQVDVGCYLVNKKFPWLFSSLDGAIVPGSRMVRPDGSGFLLENGEFVLTDRYCPLECKAMSFYALKQWEGDMDPGYIAQVHQQMLVTESVYSEIVVLQDGRSLKIFPVYLDPDLAEQIIRVSQDVWFNKVVPGRELVKQYTSLVMKNDKIGADQVFAEIQSLEPEVTAGEAYKEWLKKQIQDKGDRARGSVKHWGWASKMKKAKKYKKLLEEVISEYENNLLNHMRVNNISQMDLGKDVRVSYNKRSGRLSVSGVSTPEVDAEALKKLI